MRRIHTTTGSRLNAGGVAVGSRLAVAGMGPVSQISTKSLGVLGNAAPPPSADFSTQLLHDLGIDPANITNQVFIANVRDSVFIDSVA